MTREKASVDLQAILAKVGAASEYQRGQIIYSQGDIANSVFYIGSGQAKLTVLSRGGKEAIIAILRGENFFGEGCLAGEPVRMATSTMIEPGAVFKIEKKKMVRALHERHAFSDLFIRHMLQRNIRVQADLVDQLFNSTEKRLARALLLLAHYGDPDKPATDVPKISHQTLAEMIGTTRARVSVFMNKFRKLGFIEYNGKLLVRNSLLGIVLHD